MFKLINYHCGECDNVKSVYEHIDTPDSFHFDQFEKCSCDGSYVFSVVQTKSIERDSIPEGATIVVNTSDLNLYIAAKRILIENCENFTAEEIQKRAANMIKNARAQSSFIPCICINQALEEPTEEELIDFAKGVFQEDYEKIDLDYIKSMYSQKH